MIEKKEYFKDGYAKIDLTKKRLAELKDYEKNNKIHPEIQKETLKEIIEEVGYDVPIIIDKHDVIVAGHCRKEVLTLLGAEYVDVIVKDKLSDKQIRKYRLLDNKIAELAEDHTENIHFELEELEDPKLNELYGFEIETLDPDKEAIEDDVPEVSDNIIVEKGDIFQLGNHRLLCGDSTNIDDVEKLMDGEKADMVFTDPPYGVKYTGGNKFENGKMKSNGREMIKNDDIDLYEEAVDICNLFCVGPIFMWYADTVSYGLYRGLEKVGADIVALLIWKKKGGYGAMGASYKPNHEPCILWKPKGAKLNFIGATNENRIWEIDKDGINKLHPTQKPISIPERAISNHKAHNVLDLFGGSGSTLIASEKTNRKCYMMELDEKYIQVILKRYKDYTDGKKEIKCLNRELNLDTILN